MRLLPLVLALAVGIAGCRETARCPDGQRYIGRACGAPVDSGADADVDAALVDGGQDAGPPCGGACDEAHCDAGAGVCRDCIADSECDADPDLPICGPGGTCIACDTDEQCATADPASPNCTGSGACVACDAANEAAICTASETCDIPTAACVAVPPRTRRICESCGSDLQCQSPLSCVPMTFMGSARDGGHCLPPQGSPACVAPYLSLLTSRTTLSGIGPASYCGPNESRTTCEAVLALVASRPCPGGDASACMAEGAVCATVGAASNRCTYACAIADECPGLACATTCGGT